MLARRRHHKGWDQKRQDAVTRPQAYEGVLAAHPDLRLCLAHFGGDADWIALLDQGFDPDDPGARDSNWVSVICRMIESGRLSQSLHGCHLYDLRLRSRRTSLPATLPVGDSVNAAGAGLLFGSDYYMTRQEALSEKAVSIRLRDALGEAVFHHIADVDPRAGSGRSASRRASRLDAIGPIR